MSTRLWSSPRLRHGLGADYVVANVRGVAAGCQGRGLWSVRDGQLVDGLHADAHLHAPGAQRGPVRALPVLHRGDRAVPALHRRLHPRDTRTLAGGDRELLQDGTHVHHQAESLHRADKLNLTKKRESMNILQRMSTFLCSLYTVTGPMSFKVKLIHVYMYNLMSFITSLQ